MPPPRDPTYTAFVGHRLLACGDGPTVAAAAARAAAEGAARLLIFDDATGAQAELGRPDQALDMAPRSTPRARPARGRPKLGVVPREVTLLPRHWDWLAAQRGGASATLRRLVEAASRAGGRSSPEVRYRVMQALAADLPGYEEALRALFAGDEQSLAGCTRQWPHDVRAYLSRLSNPPAA